MDAKCNQEEEEVGGGGGGGREERKRRRGKCILFGRIMRLMAVPKNGNERCLASVWKNE